VPFVKRVVHEDRGARGDGDGAAGADRRTREVKERALVEPPAILAALYGARVLHVDVH
jgi:hypothetical protein